MSLTRKRLFALFLPVLLLIGCQSQRPTGADQVAIGRIILQDDFSEGFEWDQYDSEAVRLVVEDGVYRGSTTGGQYIFGLNNTSHNNVVIDIDAMMLSGELNNGYGVMCRADPANNGEGYYFLVGADGSATIRRGQDKQVKALVAWEKHDAIKQGIRLNQLRVFCVDDYLALYVNGEFIMETRDNLYSSGHVGVAFVSLDGDEIAVEFDNLTVREASFAD